MNTFRIFLCVLFSISKQVNSQCDPFYFFQCSNGNCLPPVLMCDGVDNCGDGSDEKNSSGVCPTCPSTYFVCANGQCVHFDSICDGWNQCGDNSDERDPVTGDCPSCPVGTFPCKNGQCTNAEYICNGKNDCGDMSDEYNSTTGTCPECPGGSFACGDFGSPKCISPWYVCDGWTLCQNGNDEKYCRCPSLSQQRPEKEKLYPEIII